MLELICKRLLLAIPTLLLVSMMVFGLQKLLPGDPLIAMAGEERDPAVIAQLRAELNLDAPIPVQYFHWLTRALQGDLGVSLRTHARTGNRAYRQQTAGHAGAVAAGDDHRPGVRHQHGDPRGGEQK